MANATLPPYKGHPAAEILAFEHGTDGETMSPEMVWEATVTHDDLSNLAATTTGVITFGGTEENGDYETAVLDAAGTELERITTTRAGGFPALNDDLATQHADDITSFLATTLAGVIASATADGVDVVVVGEPGAVFRLETYPPGATTMAFEHTVGIDLNLLQPNDAFPALALRGEAPTLRVLEAWPAGAVATLDDAGVASTDVLALVAIDALGWVGDTGTSLGSAHKTETGWTPTLHINLGEDPIATTGELKVQVTHSPLPE
jgi:hypothetical protein